MIPTHNYLIVSAIGTYRSETISDLAKLCLQCGCNVLNSKISSLGQDLAIVLFLCGNWGAIAKMEAALPGLEQRLGLNIQAHRTRGTASNLPSIAYSLQIIAIDKGGILSGLTDFFQKFNIQIDDLNAYTYSLPNSTQMVSMQFKINVSDKVHLATLREQFMSYCDDHNLDGFMEPIKSLC